MSDRARIGRRAVLLLAAASLTAASAPPRADVPAIMEPLPLPPAPPARAVELAPVAHWASVFQQSWDYQYENSLPMSRSADSWDHYDLSYSVDACVAMFRATGEHRYLDRALEFVENVAAAARPSSSLPGSGFRDRYRGWASSASGQGGDEVPLYESYFWRYGTALLLAMRDDPAVHGDPAYRARHDRLLAFAETHVFDKWYSRGPREAIYRERTHMAAHWALIALNLSRVTADPARRRRYVEVAGNIDLHLPGSGASLRGQLRRHPAEPTAYFWSDVWGSARRPGQDVSHGNGVLAYVVEARDCGRPWTVADMAAFGALLTRVIWPGGTTYRAYVDGTGADNGWFSDGFVKLGRYDAAVQQRLEQHQVVNDQFAANMALNARILRS
ncbi:hypothetical protein GCM10020358_58800 [Amorphoplanes nipponensis]|uniref:Glycosyl hydrolase family 76 n=1 Tax=Actinoplanes nipponensis TaxID=135950 RepID=A0A919JCX0_9ACTN|nr:hypothetical protein [Actinoplanes nipponensis]GIE46861.1 hypothetical protein Ani05nite_03950 [Actinoplanes nipponensis]